MRRLPDEVHPVFDQPHAAEAGVVVDHASIGGDEQNAEIHRRQERDQTRTFLLGFFQIFALQAFCRPQFIDGLAQVGFGRLEVVDAVNTGPNPLVDPAVIVNWLPVHQCPEMSAILAADAERIALAGRAAQRLAQLEGGGFTVFLVNDVGREIHLLQTFVHAVAQHALDRRVDPQELAFGRQPEFQIMGVVGDGMKACFILARPFDVESYRLGHPVEGADELADLVLAFARQFDVQIALRHAFAGTGEGFETANDAACRQGKQESRQQQGGGCNQQALLQVACTGFMNETAGQHQRDLAIVLARQFNGLRAPGNRFR